MSQCAQEVPEMADEILCLTHNPGGCRNLLPVVQQLRALTDRKVVLIASGTASAVLEATEEQFTYFGDTTGIEDLTDICPDPVMVITSMDAVPNIGLDAMVAYRDRAIRVALQDFWGGQMGKPGWGGHHEPDVLFVNDDEGKRITKIAWPNFPQNNVVVTGYPYLDRFCGVDWPGRKSTARVRLDVSDDAELVVFAGQLGGSAKMLETTVGALNDLGFSQVLIARGHPRMPDDEIGPWKEALDGYRGRVVDTTDIGMDVVSEAASVVVSMYSTSLVEAVMRRQPNVSILDETGKQMLMTDTGGLLTQFPLVPSGATASAIDQMSLRHTLDRLLTGETDLTEAQENTLVTDGRNAERVAKALLRMLK